MALLTLGTVANNSLDALVFKAGMVPADLASIVAGIKNQSNPTHPIWPGAFNTSGQLVFPNRQGFLNLRPGDYVAFDSFGWPIVVSSESIAYGSTDWAHS